MLGVLMVVSREPGWKPRDDDRALLTLLAPNLAQAAVLGFQLTEGRSGVTVLLDILDAFVIGVVLLDSSGNLSFANASAASLLRIPAGLVAPGSLEGRRATQVREALRALSRPPTEDGQGLHVVAAPLDPVDARLGVNARFATALFISERVRQEAGTKRFAALYGLTPAEERLALKLGAGASLAAAARQLGIQVATARSELRAVFKKTRTHRQTDLVRMVHAAVGQIRTKPPGG
jgi:DNA-binding CsgD family transcriptional regulator